MNRTSGGWLVAVLGVGLLCWGAVALTGTPEAPPAPPAPAPAAPVITPAPAPAPDCPSCPDCPAPKPKRPWGDAVTLPVGGKEFFPPRVADEPDVDLLAVPKDGRPRNVGGRDGAGLCVFTSCQYAGWYLGEPELKVFQKKMRQEPGGGTPKKLEAMMRKYCPGAFQRMVQYEGADPKVIELAHRTGRPVCITWGGNHMLNSVHLDSTRGCIVDNNNPDKYQWFSRETYLRSARQGGGMWVVVFLKSPPPPPPFNLVGNQPRPPAEPPLLRWALAPARPPVGGNGMSWKPWWRKTARYTVAGVECTKDTAIQAILGGLEDDSTKLFLTAIGPPAERQKVLSDLDGDPALAAYKGKLHAAAYDPSAWEVAPGFRKDGRPTIYLQNAKGKVLHRQDDYQGGAAALAQALEKATSAQGLRKPQPYDPAKDPECRRPHPQAPKSPWYVLAGGGLCLLALLLLSKKS